MKPQQEITTVPVDQAESRARKVASLILSDLGRLNTESYLTQDDDDQPGTYARTVLAEFRKGVVAAADGALATTGAHCRPARTLSSPSPDCDSMQKRRQSMHNMHHSLAATLFPGYRRRVLALLLLRPEESLHGREIARRTGLPAGTLTRELKRLAEVGLLTQEKQGNQVLYRANRASPIFAELAGILRKTSGLADVIAEALVPLSDQINIAFVFGSVARGTETAGSDIDILIIGAVDFGAVIEVLYPAQQQLTREINPKVFSIREWKSKLKEKSFFATDVLAKPKIFLIGDEHELAELARLKP
jgi:predicted nucleotidyltransferase/DNA-binding HxlR family transcriptional regulator